MSYDPKIKRQLKELRPKIEDYLKSSVSSDRYGHIERVAKTAKKYAKKLGLDHYKAELSGLLHDIAKQVSNEKLLEIAKARNISLDDVDLINPHILHARVGEFVAKEEFGINDEEVLSGIRCHTLGEPKMSKIAMLLYLADATEPKREKKSAAPVRKTFKEKGLEHAVLHAMNSKLLHVLQKNGLVHPLTIKARNWLLELVKH